MKKQRGYSHIIGILIIVALAIGLRFTLMAMHWPVANADESIMDLMARHIAYQGEHPIFFWGQDHMGTIQAYLGAIFIHFFGSSAFIVRLGTLFLFACYSISLYFLVRVLYTPAYALFITALLSIGTERMMSVPLLANGGYAETMLFAALLFLLACQLSLTTPLQHAPISRARLLMYAALGGVAGLALWSDQLVLPAILAAGLLLGRYCRRELRGWASGALVAGLLVGSAPLLLYNLSAPLGQNSLMILLGTTFSGLPRTIPVWQEMLQTLLIALPLMTAMPLSSGIPTVCQNAEPYTHPIQSLADFFPGSHPWACVGTRSVWALLIIVLWCLAVYGTVVALRQMRKANPTATKILQEPLAYREHVRLYTRLLLLGSGALWLLLFSFSAGGQWTPSASSRYLICLLLVVPAALWPLWQTLSQGRAHLKLGRRFARSRFVLSTLLLATVVASYLVGLVGTFATLPDDQSAYRHVNTVVAALLNHGITRFYSDYDTCIPLIFQSNERVICSVLDQQLQPGMNRYDVYTAQVASTPHPAYLFPVNSPEDQALTQRFSRNEHYQHLVVEGESIYYWL